MIRKGVPVDRPEKQPAKKRGKGEPVQLAPTNPSVNDSEELYRILAEATRDEIFIVNRQGIVEYVNKTASKRFGKSPEKLAGRPLTELFPPAFLEHAVKNLEQAFISGKEIYAESPLVSKNKTKWLGTWLIPLHSGSEDSMSIMGVSRDITRQKQTEETLKQRADELSALQETALELAVQQDLLSLLHTIVERSVNLLKAPNGFIYLYHAASNDLELVLELGYPVDSGLRLQMGEGMAGKVAQSRSPLIVDDYSHWEGRSPIYNDIPYHSVLEVPMLFRGQLIGVLGVNDTAEQPRVFGAEDARLLMLFAGQAASVIHDARLVDGLQAELTERKRMEDSLQNAEARYRALVEQIPAIIYADSAEQAGQTLYISPQIKTLLGYDPEEWSVNNDLWSKAIHPDDRARVLNEYERSFASGETFAVEYRLHSGDGRSIWIQDKAALVRDQSGKPLFWQGLMLDVTERKEAEKALTESEERYRRLFDLSPDAIALHSGGTILLANQATLTLLGATQPDQVVGKPLLDFVHPDYRKIVTQRARQQIVGGKNVPSMEEKFIRLDGTFVDVEVIGTPITYQDTRASLVIFREITERKRAQNLQEAVYKIAVAAETTKSLNDLYPQIHEIIASVMPAENFYITLYDDVHDLLRFVYFKDAADEPFLGEIRPGQGLTAYVLRTGKSLLCTQAVHDELEHQGAVKLLGVASAIWLGVPLVIEGKTIGAVVVQHYSNPHAYSEREQHMLEFVSTQIAVSIARKQAEDALQRQLKEITILHNVSTAAAQASDTDQLIKKVTAIIGEAIYVDAFGVALLDEKEQVLRPHSSYHGKVARSLKKILPTEGIVGRVFSTGLSYCCVDVRTDPYYSGIIPETLSELCVPIKVGEKVIGVINAESHLIDFFNEDDERLLGTIADTLATALEKLRLFEAEHTRRQEAETLRQAAAAVSSSLDLHEVLNTILISLKQVVPYDSASVILLEGDKLRLTAVQGVKNPEKVLDQTISYKDYLFGSGEKTNGPVILADAQAEPRFQRWAGSDYVRGWMGVPLIARNAVIGYITIDNRKPATYDAESAALAQAFAYQAATAIENARLYELEQHRHREAETLQQASAVVSSSLEFNKVLDTILVSLGNVIDFDSASVILVQENGELKIVASRGLPGKDHFIGRRFSPSTRWRSMAENRQPLILADAQASPDFEKWEGTSYIRGWMGIPLVVRDMVIGEITVDSRHVNAFTEEDARMAKVFAHQAAIAVDNARLYENAVTAADRRAILHRAGQEIAQASQDPEKVYAAVHRAAAQLMPAEAFVITLLDNQQEETVGVYLVDKGGRWQVDHAPAGVGLSGLVISSGKAVITNDLAVDPIPGSVHFGEDDEVRSILAVPLRLGQRVIGMLSVQSYQPYAYTADDQSLLEMLAAHAAVAIENAHLYAETFKRLKELETVNHTSTILRSARTVGEMLPSLLDETLEVLNTDSGAIWLYDQASGMLKSAAVHGWFVGINENPIRSGDGIAGSVFKTGQVLVSNEFASDPLTRESTRNQIPLGWGGACIPIRTLQETVGVLFVSVPLPRQLQPDEVHLLVTLSEMAGNAIRRADLHEQTERQLQRLASLRAVDLAINTILDLRVTLGILIDHIISQLKVDAVNILLINPNTQTLYHAASTGFHNEAIKNTQLYINDSLAGQAIRTRATVHIPNLNATKMVHRAEMLAAEGFISYFGVPLIAKGQIKGILETFHRSAMEPDAEWRNFLETLAGQAAIAIDNSMLFEELQQTNLNLSLAYDATIEGWSKALDLRDQETEGHTLRVTEMTLQLAEKMGMGTTDLVHIRRGALLHDIGKMAVPDSVLRKTGPLSDDEWSIMHRHPEFARDMLSSITYLREALDIPFGHHERWDGSGYPKGLVGEQIPLAARIFAVVDVWDALISDRPYRKSWKKEAALEYISEGRGVLFDPRVVDAFLQMIAG